MRMLIVVLLISTVVPTAWAQDTALEQRVEQLEARIAELETALAPVMAKAEAEQKVNAQRVKARARMGKDAERYSNEERSEIETLYQVANKEWQTDEGKDSLKKLIEKYDQANRTGCALLYLGQMSKGEEREQYLKQAIDGFSDCYYGDGVQVGAYARYYLAYYYKEQGQQEKADALFKEIATDYPDAIDHKGRMLKDMME